MMGSNERAAALQMLAGCANERGVLANRDVAQVAAQFAVSTRTVRRMWAAHLDHSPEDLDDDTAAARPARPEKWWLDRDVLAVVAASPTCRDAWRTLQEDPTKDVPGYSAFTRTLKRHTRADVYAAISAGGSRGGRQAFLQHTLFVPYVQDRRNAVWQADAQEIPVDVTTNTGARRIKPWQTTFIDDATRVVVATVITTGRPTSADVLAALAAGVRGQVLPNGTRIGAIPAALRFDNGTEFINDALLTACARLGIQPQPCRPHSPWEKGKIERWHRTIQNECYDKLPGATHGPRSFTGTQYWRQVDGDVLDLRSLTIQALTWIQEYNCDRTHSALGGTPADAWANDPTELRWAEPAALYQFALALSKTRKITPEGVSVDGVKYLSPEMGAHVGRTVEVRVLPHDHSAVAVYVNGDYLCEARPAANLTNEERREILVGRRLGYEQAMAAHREGVQRRFAEAANADEDLEVEALLAAHSDDPDTVFTDEAAALLATTYDDGDEE
ncbi:DDE-type integrase/transposase/recombinase [Janibacter sp. Y6]|uniref:DDE-type integrase/transposase/recombinase n=1 Tax=Janibacter sp. Y6 TaxID=2913552 RepID=UPI0034A3E36C